MSKIQKTNLRLNYLSKDNKATRKKWLVSNFIFFGFNWILFALLLITSQIRLVSNEVIAEAGLWAFYSLLLGSLFYYFSYKKFGNRLLTWSLLSPLLIIMKYINSMHSSSEGYGNEILEYLPFWGIWDADLLGAIFVLIHSSLYCWWYFLSYKLRKINKIINPKVNENDFNYYVNEMKLAADMGNLDLKYSKSIKRWPQFEERLQKEYLLKKSELSK